MIEVMNSVEDFDRMASQLGWNYAWTRFPQQLHLLDAIEEMASFDGFKPTIVLEPGCFTGGLLHYLAALWNDVPCVGFDVSPVSLDVSIHYSDKMQHQNPPVWLRANFTQIRPMHLPDNLGERIHGGLVLLCNVIEQLGKSFQCYEYIDAWTAKSRLISYWVNQGATVLLCERHPDPQHLRDTIMQEAEWRRPNCRAAILKVYKVPTTDNMVPRNPLGDWHEADGCVIRFAPPQQNTRLL
jgi:hypothetical protein